MRKCAIYKKLIFVSVATINLCCCMLLLAGCSKSSSSSPVSCKTALSFNEQRTLFFSSTNEYEAEEKWRCMKESLKTSNSNQVGEWLDIQRDILTNTLSPCFNESLRRSAIQEYYIHYECAKSYEKWLKDCLKSGYFKDPFIVDNINRILEVLSSSPSSDGKTNAVDGINAEHYKMIASKYGANDSINIQTASGGTNKYEKLVISKLDIQNSRYLTNTVAVYEIDNFHYSLGTYLRYALVIRESARGVEPVFIENDEDALKLLSGLKIDNSDDVVALVHDFAKVRRYQLIFEQPRPLLPDNAGKPNNNQEEYSLTVSKDKDSWMIECSFWTWPLYNHCKRYKMRIGKDGDLQIINKEMIFQEGIPL